MDYENVIEYGIHDSLMRKEGSQYRTMIEAQQIEKLEDVDDEWIGEALTEESIIILSYLKKNTGEQDGFFERSWKHIWNEMISHNQSVFERLSAFESTGIDIYSNWLFSCAF